MDDAVCCCHYHSHLMLLFLLSYFVVCIIFSVGEHGVPITISRDKLSPSEQHNYDAAWQANAFNGYANDLMSLHRSLKDTRDVEYVISQL